MEDYSKQKSPFEKGRKVLLNKRFSKNKKPLKRGALHWQSLNIKDIQLLKLRIQLHLVVC